MNDETSIGHITIKIKPKGVFNAVLKRIGIKGEDNIKFKGISALRQLLSNERARMMVCLKEKEPDSIYKLGKLLKRDFKSIREDVELLKQFKFVKLVKRKVGKRSSLQPVLVLDRLEIVISF